MRVLVLTVLAALLIAAPVAAQKCVAPQGTSAVDQYCETVPTSRGEQGVDPVDGGAGGPSALPPGTTAELVEQGTDGEALARALGEDTAAAVPGRGGRESKALPQTTRPKVPSSNPFSAVTSAAGEGSTIGSPFFIALFVVVVVMLGFGWVGYRRSAS